MTFALLLPAASGSAPALPADAPAKLAADPPSIADPLYDPAANPVWRELLTAFEPLTAHQVRIEQRVVIRITPRQAGPARTDLLAPVPPRESPPRYEEQPLGKCIPMKEIVGVQTTDNRLVLFMGNHSLVSAALEKACSPRDFYSGFYVEKNDDGLLCIKRDKLQSRTGAKCRVQQLARLVALED